jgi:hypothetical protein
MISWLKFCNEEKLKLQLCKMELTGCIHYSLIFLCDDNSTTQFFADYIHHQTSFSFRKLCIEDDKLTIDLQGTLSDILAYHTLFCLQNKLSPQASVLFYYSMFYVMMRTWDFTISFLFPKI